MFPFLSLPLCLVCKPKRHNCVLVNIAAPSRVSEWVTLRGKHLQHTKEAQTAAHAGCDITTSPQHRLQTPARSTLETEEDYLMRGRSLSLFPTIFTVNVFCSILSGSSHVTRSNHLTCFWMQLNTDVAPALALKVSFLIWSFLYEANKGGRRIKTSQRRLHKQSTREQVSSTTNLFRDSNNT